jgi:hypothetical protein
MGIKDAEFRDFIMQGTSERGDLEGNLLQQLQDQTEHDEGGAFHVFITKH